MPRAETKTNVNVEEKDGVRQGVVTFTENDRLYLFETKKDFLGGTYTNIITSSGTITNADNRVVDFLFALSSDTFSASELTYIAAAGDWSLNRSTMEVNIPASFDMKDNGASLLPGNGVIAMSDPYSGTYSQANKIFSSHVRLNHLVSYGILNITGLTGKRITNIQIENLSGAPVAGKATISLQKTGAYTDISTGAWMMVSHF